MRFFQADNVFEVQVGQHFWIIPSAKDRPDGCGRRRKLAEAIVDRYNEAKYLSAVPLKADIKVCMGNLFNITPQFLITYFILILICFPVHELAHAWTATAYGDDTARNSGRLTLNPLAHIDPVGAIVLFVSQGFGWAKPVPINPYALERRSPAAPMIVSLAGPLSNLAMAILAGIPWRLGLISLSPTSVAGSWIAQISYTFIIINLSLMLFNLIPLAPLDGEKVLEYFLPPNLQQRWESIRPYSSLILMAIVFLPYLFNVNILGAIMNPPLTALFHLITGVVL
jgi:Zn-dependent protease